MTTSPAAQAARQDGALFPNECTRLPPALARSTSFPFVLFLQTIDTGT